jgi:alpha-galactosidase
MTTRTTDTTRAPLLGFCVLVLMVAANAASAAGKPLKVFLLAGQSNMQGHASVATFDALAEDPKTASLLEEMRTPDGKPRVCDKVWISSIGCLGDAYTDLNEKTGKLTAGFGAPSDKIGPEFTFGITMEKRLGGPVLLIKTSWGGRSLHTDFRPPSAGPYAWGDYELAQYKRRGDDLDKIKADKVKATGVFYRHMIAHVRKVLADIKRVVPDYDPKQGYELAGFVWFQGFNDLVADWTYEKRMKPGGYDQYGELLAHLIRDVRKDLSAPKMPVVIGVMGIGGAQEGKKPPQSHFRQAQAAPASLPEFKGNVVAVETAPYWDDDLDALQRRMEKVNEKLYREFRKDPSLKRAAKEEGRKKAIEEQFKPEELKRLKAGVSNGGYHYLGAAKILAPIGKAFAEALLGGPSNAGGPPSDRSLLTIDRLLGTREFETESPPELRWSKRSSTYFTLDKARGGKGRDLARNDPATGKKENPRPRLGVCAERREGSSFGRGDGILGRRVAAVDLHE